MRVQIDAELRLEDEKNARLHPLAKKKLENVSIVCEYLDVFLDELPGMPPDWDIEFIIDLVPRTRPIAKRLCRMPGDELAELKK